MIRTVLALALVALVVAPASATHLNQRTHFNNDCTGPVEPEHGITGSHYCHDVALHPPGFKPMPIQNQFQPEFFGLLSPLLPSYDNTKTDAENKAAALLLLDNDMRNPYFDDPRNNNASELAAALAFIDQPMSLRLWNYNGEVDGDLLQVDIYWQVFFEGRIRTSNSDQLGTSVTAQMTGTSQINDQDGNQYVFNTVAAAKTTAFSATRFVPGLDSVGSGGIFSPKNEAAYTVENFFVQDPDNSVNGAYDLTNFEDTITTTTPQVHLGLEVVEWETRTFMPRFNPAHIPQSLLAGSLSIDNMGDIAAVERFDAGSMANIGSPLIDYTTLFCTSSAITGGFGGSGLITVVTTRGACKIFLIYTWEPAEIIGDPEFFGFLGQQFQIHGIPNEFYNVITASAPAALLQVNSKFVYLDSARCPDNGERTACWTHPGTYFGELGFKLGMDARLHIVSGSWEEGMTVTLDGEEVPINETVLVKGGSRQRAIERTSQYEVIVQTEQFRFVITNADGFLNQAVSLLDPIDQYEGVHGLLGQTWQDKEYPNAIKYIEGSVDDYQEADQDIFGDSFVFNRFM